MNNKLFECSLGCHTWGERINAERDCYTFQLCTCERFVRISSGSDTDFIAPCFNHKIGELEIFPREAKGKGTHRAANLYLYTPGIKS